MTKENSKKISFLKVSVFHDFRGVGFCSGLVQAWFRFGSGLVQVWFRSGSGLVLVGSSLVQVWFMFGSGLVQVWLGANV